MKRFTISILLIALCISIPALSKDNSAKLYFTEEDMPDAYYFLPAPPAWDSEAFAYDSCQFEWGKSVRDSERGKMAKADANTSAEYIASIFSPILGIEISERNTPEIFKLLKKAAKTAGKADNHAKTAYMRTRPFVYFNYPSLTPEDEEALSKNGSYPSGHTLLGWVAALVFCEIDPADQNAILARGYEYGQSRVIVGVHWQSDVNAGRLVASAAFARLHTSAQYTKQLHKAQKEYAAKKKSVR